MSKEIELQLTALHPAQWQVVQQAKRFNVVCCGRRWGKTVLGMDRLIHPALEGRPVACLRRIVASGAKLQVTLEPVMGEQKQSWSRSRFVSAALASFLGEGRPKVPCVRRVRIELQDLEKEFLRRGAIAVLQVDL